MSNLENNYQLQNKTPEQLRDDQMVEQIYQIGCYLETIRSQIGEQDDEA